LKFSPSHILVFRFGQIGDTVAALPSLWVLRQTFPNARIVLLNEIPAKKTHLPPETVLPPFGLVDGYEQYPAGASLRNFLAAWRQLSGLRKQGYTTLVYLVPSVRTIRQRIRDRIFFGLAGFRHLLATKGFSENRHPKTRDGKPISLPKEADALMERLRLDGLPIPTPNSGRMDLKITEAERGKAHDWLGQNVGPKTISKGWVAICTGGKFTAKLWPWERYAEVVSVLIEQHGLFPVLIGGPEDREVGKKLLSKWGTGVCAAGELTVRESAALMESARFYLGNDTGVMHLAAAVGLRCVAIFSARSWAGMWEPYGAGHKVLRFEVPCAGCECEVCPLPDHPCLQQIKVDQVLNACNQVLAEQI